MGSKVIFSLTEDQAFVLNRLGAGQDIRGSRRSFYALQSRGLVAGSPYSEPKLTPLGKAAHALLERLAKSAGHSSTEFCSAKQFVDMVKGPARG